MSLRKLFHDINSYPSDDRPSEFNNVANSRRNEMERCRADSVQVFGGGSINLHRHFGICVQDENMGEHGTLVNAICKKLADTLSLSANEFRILETFITTSKVLSTALGNRAEVHSLIEIENSSLDPERLVVAAVYSKFFSRQYMEHYI